MRSQFETLAGECMTQLNEARGHSLRSKLASEIRLLDSRHKLLRLVLDSDIAALAAHIKSQQDEAAEETPKKSSKGSVCSDSRDMNEVIFGGPCNNYEKLITLDEYKAEGSGFSDAESQAALDNHWKSVREVGAHYHELKKAVLAAKTDLASALAGLRAPPKEAVPKKKPAPSEKDKAGAAAKKKAKRGPTSVHDFTPAEGRSEMRKHSGFDNLDFSAPFLIEPLSLEMIFEKDCTNAVDRIKQEISDVTSDWNASDIKVTDGRCQSRFEDSALSVATRHAYQSLFKEAFADIGPHLMAASVSGLTSLDPAVWLMVRGHLDTKFEPCGQAALRQCVSGMRQLAMVAHADIVSFLKRNLKPGGTWDSKHQYLAVVLLQIMKRQT